MTETMPPPGTTPVGDVAFPPAPWDLTGHMTILLWMVPTALVAHRVPRGTRPLSVARRSIICTAWVAYQPGSVVSYNELLSAVPVWDGRAVRQTVTDIWVDDPVSAAGGRALWGIPKDLATFPVLDGRRFAAGRADASTGGRRLTPSVHARFRPVVALPHRVRARWLMVHEREGRRVVARSRLIGRPAIGRGTMTVDPDGHLGFLAGRRPFAAFQVTDMDITVGCR